MHNTRVSSTSANVHITSENAYQLLHTQERIQVFSVLCIPVCKDGKHFCGGTLLLNDKSKKQHGIYSTNLASERKVHYVCGPGLISEMLSKNKKRYEYTNVDYLRMLFIHIS